MTAKTTPTYAMDLKPGDHIPGMGDVTYVDPGYGYTQVTVHSATGTSSQTVPDGMALPVLTN